MKLFLATNSGTSKTCNILMLEKAVKTAMANTPFEIYVIYDGRKNELNVPRQVHIIEHRHRLYDVFKNSPRNTGEVMLNTASGAFLRTELPFLCKKLNFKDKHVFYTDYDVLFERSDYSGLQAMKPRIFAACPEGDRTDWRTVNTGAMLMNVDYFYQNDRFILDYIREHFEDLTVWDQSMYNTLYKGMFDRLPIEYNWKVYWGVNHKAKIIHFHGAKPKLAEPGWRFDLPQVKHIREIDEESYGYYNQKFENA